MTIDNNKGIQNKFKELKEITLLTKKQELEYSRWLGHKVISSDEPSIKRNTTDLKDLVSGRTKPQDVKIIENKVKNLLVAVNEGEIDLSRPEEVSWLKKIQMVVHITRKNFDGANLKQISELDEKLENTMHLYAVLGRVTPDFSYESKEEALKLISEGVDLSAKNSSGQTALHMALLNGWNDVAHALIKAGVDVNAKNSSGQTALSSDIWVVARDNVGLLKLLAVNDIRDIEGKTVLIWAVEQGDAKAVKLLLAAKAGPDNERREALELAVREGKGKAEDLKLIDDPNGPFNEWSTAFKAAADRNDVKILKPFAGDNFRDNEGYTALASAIYDGNEHLVKLLLEAKANPNR